MASTLELLRRLTAQNVEFVLVGGMAAIAHGASTVTEDADVCIRFDAQTIERVLRAVADLNPRNRMHPARPPVSMNVDDYAGFKNLYLATDEGVLDLLSEIVAVGGLEEVARNAVSLDLGGFSCRVVGLDELIRCKRALGRPKDQRVVQELSLVLRRLALK